LLCKNSTRDYFNAEMDSTDNFNEPPGGILWETGENVKDFITSIVKAIGGLVFSLIDGALFVSTGDGSSYNSVDSHAFWVQDINNLSGKLLRIDGTSLWISQMQWFNQQLILSHFYSYLIHSTWTGKVCQATHTMKEMPPQTEPRFINLLRYRNPWHLSIDASSGWVFIWDVGWSTWEEINSGDVSGANQGWQFFREESEKVLFRWTDMQTLSRVKNSLLKKTQKIKWFHQFMLSTIRLMVSMQSQVTHHYFHLDVL
jgi:hypothetical protein